MDTCNKILKVVRFSVSLVALPLLIAAFPLCVLMLVGLSKSCEEAESDVKGFSKDIWGPMVENLTFKE